MVGAELPLTVERHIVATFAWSDDVRVPAHGDLPNGYYSDPKATSCSSSVRSTPNPRSIRTISTSGWPDEASQLGARVVKRAPPAARDVARGGRACTT